VGVNETGTSPLDQGINPNACADNAILMFMANPLNNYQYKVLPISGCLLFKSAKRKII
jgi:hypothetical protein